MVDEMAKVGVQPHLAEPADTAALRGPKRRAKSDRADAKHLRELLDVGMLPECYIPPDRVLEWRATLELYSDLRIEHSGWVQRIHAVCFHQGTTAVGPAGVVRGSRERLARIVADQLSPVGRLQVNTALAVMDALDEHLARLRRRIVATAEHVAGAQALRQAIYGVGPMTALALVSWLGGANRFTSSRKAVRFVGLDITGTPPTANADPDGCPGRARKCCAGCCSRRPRPPPAASRRRTTTTPRSGSATTATGRRCRRPGASSGKPCTSSPASAMTPSPPPPPRPHRPGSPLPGGRSEPAATITMGYHRGQLPPIRCQTASPPVYRRRGRPYETERSHSPPAGSHPIDHHVARHNASCLQAIGKPGCPQPHPIDRHPA